MNIEDLKSKNTVMEGQITQILLRELDMIYKQVGKCKLDISKPFDGGYALCRVYIGSYHSIGDSSVQDSSLEDQVFVLKRLPIALKRLKKELVKSNKSAAMVLDLYSQRLDSFILAKKHTNEVFMMTMWVLGIVASGIWSRILF